MFVEWTCISTILQCMPHRLLFTWYPWYMAVSEAALTHPNAIPNPLVRNWFNDSMDQKGSKRQFPDPFPEPRHQQPKSDSFEGDEEIVSRKLETRIVELRKMGKLPNQNLGEVTAAIGPAGWCFWCFYVLCFSEVAWLYGTVTSWWLGGLCCRVSVPFSVQRVLPSGSEESMAARPCEAAGGPTMANLDRSSSHLKFLGYTIVW